jgi:hypothetical protein
VSRVSAKRFPACGAVAAAACKRVAVSLRLPALRRRELAASSYTGGPESTSERGPRGPATEVENVGADRTQAASVQG